MMEACRTDGYPEPAWRELVVALRVVFYPHPEVVEHSAARVPVNAPVNERQLCSLVQHLASQGMPHDVVELDLNTRLLARLVPYGIKREIGDLRRITEINRDTKNT